MALRPTPFERRRGPLAWLWRRMQSTYFGFWLRSDERYYRACVDGLKYSERELQAQRDQITRLTCRLMELQG